jgi:hypothetical protein
VHIGHLGDRRQVAAALSEAEEVEAFAAVA